MKSLHEEVLSLGKELYAIKDEIKALKSLDPNSDGEVYILGARRHVSNDLYSDLLEAFAKEESRIRKKIALLAKELNNEET